MKKKVTPWPNGIGWDVRTSRGDAVVADVVRRLSVSIPMPPRREPVDDPRPGKPAWVEVERRRLAYVPLGTDPVEAVRLCREHGRTFDLDELRFDPDHQGRIPEVAPAPEAEAR
jgi:hypothetical protein